jgi:hypothetical protein
MLDGVASDAAARLGRRNVFVGRALDDLSVDGAIEKLIERPLSAKPQQKAA